MNRLTMIRKTIGFDEKTVDELDHYAKREERDFTSAPRYALKIGLLALNNPELIMKPINSYVAQHVINRLPEIAITSLGGDTVLYGSLALAMEAKKTHLDYV